MPAPRLQRYVHRYWRLKTNIQLAEPYRYRVVADGCIDLFFEAHRSENSFIMGFSDRYTEFTLPKEFDYIGVRFSPAMLPKIFLIDASDLTNRTESLQAVLPRVSKAIEDRISSADSMRRVVDALDEYLLQTTSGTQIEIDSRFDGAVDLILKNRGRISVGTGLETGISPRHLRRLFKYHVGGTPKQFSEVVRFQNILASKPSVQSLRKEVIHFDAGYYDQAHFIREFKRFYGLPPGKAL
jgi:hypothetical protein